MRWLRRILLICLIAGVALPVLVIVLALAWLQTDLGHRQLAELIAWSTRGSATEVTVGAIEGSIPVDITLRDVHIADRQGDWLRGDNIHLAWSPMALFSRSVKIDILHADTLTLIRTPASTTPEPTPPPASSEGFTLPHLPVNIQLDSLSLDQVSLPQALVGTAMTLSVQAQASAERSGDLTANLAAHRLDTENGSDDVTAAIAYLQATDHLKLDLNVSEPQGGLVTRLSGIQGNPHLSIVAKGDAPLSKWSGTVSARLDDTALLDMAATIGGTSAARQFDISLTTDPSPFLPANVRQLVSGGLHLTTAGKVLSEAGANMPRLQIDSLHLTGKPADITAAGLIDPDGDSNLHVQIVALNDAFVAMLPQLAWKNAKIDADISGHVALPTVKLSGVIDELQYDKNQIGHLALTMAATPGESSTSPIGVSATATASGVVPAASSLRSLTTNDIRLGVTGSLDRQGNIAATAISLATGFADLTGQAQATAWGQTAQATLSLKAPDLKRFREIANLPLQGSAQINLVANKSPSGATLTVDGTTDGFAAGQAQVDNLLGPKPQLTLHINQSGSQVDIQQADVTGQSVKISATGHASPDDLAVAITGALPNLASIDKTLTGDLGLKIDVTGTADHPTLAGQINAGKIVAANIATKDLSLQVQIPDLKTLSSIHAAGKASVNGLLANLATDAGMSTVDGKTTIKVDRLTANLGQTSLTAQAQIVNGLATGRATAKSPNLAELKPITQADAKGDITLDTTFNAGNGQQAVNATVMARGIAYGDTAEISQLKIDAKVLDALKNPTLQSRIDLTDATIAKEKLAAAHATFSGPLSQIAFDLGGKGPRLDFDLAGKFAHQPPIDRLTLDRAKVSAFGQQVTLLHAASVTHQGNSTQIDNVALVNGTGQIQVNGKLTPDSNQLDVEINRLSLALLSIAAPSLHVDGEINGAVHLTGNNRNPQATVTLSADHVASKDMSIPPLSAKLTADWRNGEASGVGDIKLSSQDQPLHVTASMPLAADPATGFPRPDAAAEMTASVKGKVDLALANSLLLDSVSRVTGEADIDLKAAGPLSKPNVSGQLAIVNGSYGNLRTGTKLRAIEAKVIANGMRFDLQKLDAKTPGNGTLGGSGYVDLTNKRDISIHITAKNAQLLDTALASAITDADLAISTKDEQDMQMTGVVKIDRAEIRIPDSVSSSVQEIPVTEKNVEAKTFTSSTSPAAAPDAQAKAAPPMHIALDLTIDAPQQVAVRGRGLDAELGGKLHVGGDASQPSVTGKLNLRHGTFDLVGRNLDFDRGIITFDGGTPIDPELDFEAKTKAESYDIIVTVSGTATKPALALTSTPALPQDEALARLLFGREAGSLTALQAIQLAQATATLAGINSGPGILDKVRDATGLDRLSIDTGDDAGSKTAATGPSLDAGRYVAPGVYLGVKQGVKVGSSAATVEIDITPHVKLETDVGADDNSKAGVNMQWDY